MPEWLRHCVDHPPPFAHIVADGLLDIHILAGLNRPDRGKGMPVVRQRDRNGVDFLVVQDPAQVLNVLWSLAITLGKNVLGLVGHARINVANRGQSNVGKLAQAINMLVTSASNAKNRHPDHIIGTSLLRVARFRLIGPRRTFRGLNRGNPRRDGGRAPQELTTVELAHRE